MFKLQGGAYFRTDLKWLAHKIWMLESNFRLVGRKFVRCFIVLFKISRHLVESKPFKTSCELIFFQIIINFSKKRSNFSYRR